VVIRPCVLRTIDSRRVRYGDDRLLENTQPKSPSEIQSNARARPLREKGATLLTTNYDDVLKKYYRLVRISRSSLGEISKFQQGALPGVFHIHSS